MYQEEHKSSGDDAFTGGLLVVLGLIIAMAMVVFFYNYKADSSPQIIEVQTDQPAASPEGVTQE